MTTPVEAERRAWELLTRDFRWDLPPDLGVQLYGNAAAGPARLQVFELAIAAIFAQLRPDYEWFVSPNAPDGGIDFVGRHGFLLDDTLGIAAAITVGGQCKKRNRVDDIPGELGGSLLRMARNLDPTFFVVALSARLDPARVAEAKSIIESTHHRHCHILDRDQIEGLIAERLPVVERIMREALEKDEAEEVVEYLRRHKNSSPLITVESSSPERVLAGQPFEVSVAVRSLLVTVPGARFWWAPSDASGSPIVFLLGPLGADGRVGTSLVQTNDGEDPILAQHTLELVTYAIGEIDLGEIRVGLHRDGETRILERISLGRVRVVENVRPRFFDRPFLGALIRLDQEYSRSLGGAVVAVGVIGAGGSGKSRLCEEFGIAYRRRGAQVLSARQAKTLDDPHRILADLFTSLAGGARAGVDSLTVALDVIAGYDRVLADRVTPALETIFGLSDPRSGKATEQSVLSALAVLICARARSVPLIIHLQDLHWCTADVLLIFERLVWQLNQLRTNSTQGSGGILFLLEGRVHEQPMASVEDGWASEPFEALIDKLDRPPIKCSSFTPEDGLTFIQRLFEDRQSTNRWVHDDLLEMQRELIEEIDRTAGGNPFHSLEQVQLLKERRVIGQNPQTGLLYLIQPPPQDLLLPNSVFAAIQLRWRYLRIRSPDLALLVWGTALIDDHLPARLFRELWRELAPDVSLNEIEATDMLWTGGGDGLPITFRHENYFRSVRRFEVPTDDRRRVVEIYSRWFENGTRRDAADRFRWARVLLELPEPAVARARGLLADALVDARNSGDQRLARRIQAASLDSAWEDDDCESLPQTEFLQLCDEELSLIRDLLGADRFQAKLRLRSLQSRLKQRGRAEDQGGPSTDSSTLLRRQLSSELVEVQIMFNDGQPGPAAELSGRALRRIVELRTTEAASEVVKWTALKVEATHSHAIALALAGQIDDALQTSARAVEMSRSLDLAITYRVRATYGNILLARDPLGAARFLRRSLRDLPQADEYADARNSLMVNLSMALVLLAYPLDADLERRSGLLDEAQVLLGEVFTRAFRLGHYSHAAAAALMLGIISAVCDDGADVSWFAQAVAAASHGHKMETLWRAHINLAMALHRKSGSASGGVRDHARAALEILDESLRPYGEPDRSARFELVRVPLAQIVRLLRLADDDVADEVLRRYPRLQEAFADLDAVDLIVLRQGAESHEWLRVGRDDYVIY